LEISRANYGVNVWVGGITEPVGYLDLFGRRVTDARPALEPPSLLIDDARLDDVALKVVFEGGGVTVIVHKDLALVENHPMMFHTDSSDYVFRYTPGPTSSVEDQR